MGLKISTDDKDANQLLKSSTLLRQAFRRILHTYKDALSNDCIKKPVAFALYRTWRYVNNIEQERE